MSVESFAIWILVPLYYMQFFLRCRISTGIDYISSIWACERFLNSDWLLLAPQKMLLADNSIYFTYFYSVPVPRHGERNRSAYFISVLSQRGTLFQMESIAFFFQVPTFAIIVSLLSDISSNTITLSLPNRSYIGVWTKKAICGKLICIRSTFKLLFFKEKKPQIPVFIPKIKRTNPENEVQIIMWSFFFFFS